MTNAVLNEIHSETHKKKSCPFPPSHIVISVQFYYIQQHLAILNLQMTCCII
jgi:hypothetical protein